GADVELSCLRAKNALDLLLLILAQGSAENGATIAAELVQHCIGIGGAEKGVHRRITRLDHRPDLLNKFLGDTEFILPPGCVEGAPCRAQRGAAGSGRGNRPCGHAGAGSAGEGNGECGSDQRTSQTAPSGALACCHLQTLIDSKFAVGVAIYGDRVVEVYGPVLVHSL